MSSLLAALQHGKTPAAGLNPAVPAERWLELAHHPVAEVRTTACQGLARLALFRGDWSIADPLLDLDHDDGLEPALFAAQVLDARAALPRLRALMHAVPDARLGDVLRTLELLGDTEARSTLRREAPDRLARLEARTLTEEQIARARGGDPTFAPIAAEQIAQSNPEWLARAGGSFAELAVLSPLDPEILPPATIEAARRRDLEATIAALRALVDAPLGDAPPAFRADVELHLALATSCAAQLAAEQPRKADFDRIAIAGLVFATLARARIRGGPAGALVLAGLGFSRIWETHRAGGPEAIALLAKLADAEQSTARTAFVAGTLFWRASAHATDVVRIARGSSLLWGFLHAQTATFLERELLAAIGSDRSGDGVFSLVAQLCSTEAESLACDFAASEELTTRFYLPILGRAFPTTRFLDAVRDAPILAFAELERRLALLHELDARFAHVDPKAPALLCRTCRHAWNVPQTAIVQTGAALIADPPLTCPACNAVGDALGTMPDPLLAAQLGTLPLGADETPASVLAHIDADRSPIEVMELLRLAGRSAEAVALLPRVPIERLLVQAPALARVLLRCGAPREAHDIIVRALSSADSWIAFDEDDRRSLRAALEEACTTLVIPIPEIQAPDPMAELHEAAARLEAVLPASSKVGRNDPCPCGSGRKYKKCHGG